MYDSTKKEKGKYIEITYRHTHTKQDTKKNNYNAHVGIIDHGTLEDMWLCYTKIQDVFLKKQCDSSEFKFDITDPLLSGQAKINFLQFKTENCANAVLERLHQVLGVTLLCTKNLETYNFDDVDLWDDLLALVALAICITQHYSTCLSGTINIWQRYAPGYKIYG